MNLKQLLEGKEVDFVIDYLGGDQDFAKKDGGTYTACEAKLRTTSNGEVYDHRIFPQQALTLKVGDSVRGYLNAKGYPAFDKVQSGEPRNNGMEVRKERQMAGERDQKTKKDIEIGLRGLMQAHIKEGKTNVEALDAAIEADAMVMKTSQTLFDLQS